MPRAAPIGKPYIVNMPEEIRDIWVHDYIGEPQDEGDEPPA